MKRVAEIEGEPEVGKFYLVPCLIADGKPIPVLGPEHEDKEYIRFDREHFHFDLRFLPDKNIKDRVGYLYERAHKPICRSNWKRSVSTLPSYERAHKPICSPEEFIMLVVTVAIKDKTIIEKPMKCRRRMPTFPLHNGIKILPWFSELEAAFASVKLNCLRCPHRGLPLSAENADENGVVVCPGHGLAWNIKTGEMVSRLEGVGA